MTDFYNLVPQAPEGRFDDVARPFDVDDVKALRASVQVKHTLAEIGANRLWDLLEAGGTIRLGEARSRDAALHQLRRGVDAIHLRGRRSGAVSDPLGADISFDGVSPSALCRRVHRALRRADQMQRVGGTGDDAPRWYAPLLVDLETGAVDVAELLAAASEAIEAGAAALSIGDGFAHDDRGAASTAGVLISTGAQVRHLVTARLAADILGVATLIVARCAAGDASSEGSSPVTLEGGERLRGSLDLAIERGLAAAPFADIVSFETGDRNLDAAERFARAIRSAFPMKPLAYRGPCASDAEGGDAGETSAALSAMGYRLQAFPQLRPTATFGDETASPDAETGADAEAFRRAIGRAVAGVERSMPAHGAIDIRAEGIASGIAAE